MTIFFSGTKGHVEQDNVVMSNETSSTLSKSNFKSSILFASKPLVQIIVDPGVGWLTGVVGYR